MRGRRRSSRSAPRSSREGEGRTMPDIVAERSGSILRIQLNRPAKKNALTSSMYGTIADLLDGAAKDDRTRVVLWHGAGDAFTAGNDLEDFVKNPPGPGGSAQARLNDALITFTKPLVAAVHGAAIGSGTTMLMYCDFVYAGESARFQLPFINLGLVPEFGSSFLLPLRAGYLRAAELVLLGKPFDASQAATLGLVTRVVSDQTLLTTANEVAQSLAEKPAGALQACKRLMTGALRERLEQAARVAGPGAHHVRRRARTTGRRRRSAAPGERRHRAARGRGREARSDDQQPDSGAGRDESIRETRPGDRRAQRGDSPRGWVRSAGDRRPPCEWSRPDAQTAHEGELDHGHQSSLYRPPVRARRQRGADPVDEDGWLRWTRDRLRLSDAGRHRRRCRGGPHLLDQHGRAERERRVDRACQRRRTEPEDDRPAGRHVHAEAAPARSDESEALLVGPRGHARHARQPRRLAARDAGRNRPRGRRPSRRDQVVRRRERRSRTAAALLDTEGPRRRGTRPHLPGEHGPSERGGPRPP